MCIRDRCKPYPQCSQDDKRGKDNGFLLSLIHILIEKDIILAGDADKLERVFDNLLRNAVNYSYPDTVIHLSMKRMTKEHKVLIRVQNHGRTIAKEKLEHIFEQFFRVDASRSSATGGSGLGLAIARQMCIRDRY